MPFGASDIKKYLRAHSAMLCVLPLLWCGLFSLVHSAALTSSATGNWKDYTKWSNNATPTARTGDITTSTSSTTVTGSGTAFLTELSVGNYLWDWSGFNGIGTIQSISSNTSLTLTANALVTINSFPQTFNSSGVAPIDGVTISNGHTITVNDNFTCASLAFAAVTSASSQVTVSGTYALTVSGAVTMPQPNAGYNCTIAIGAGSLTCASVSMSATSSTPTRCDIISISTGSLNVNGAITTSGGTGCQITFTGAGTMYVSGAFGTNSPTLTTFAGSTVNYDGTGQTIYATPTYAILTMGNSSGTQTAGGALTATTLNTTSGGTLDMSTYALTATNVTNSGTIKTQNTSATPLPTGIAWGGTVEYNGTTQNIVSSTSFTNLTISTSGAKTLDAATTTITGNFTVSGGSTGTFANLAGKTLIVGGNASLSGQSAVNYLNLNPGSAWTITVTGSLSASYANISYSNASGGSTGQPTNCVNEGNNSNWNFANPYLTWPQSQRIYLNATRHAVGGSGITTNLTNFPVVIRLDTSNFRYFSQTQAGGADIRFVDASGSALNFEIERWVDNLNNNDSAVIWVTTNVTAYNGWQYITMYWGNSGITTGSSPSATFATANNFKGVWHLAEAGNTVTGGYKDATGTKNATGVSMDGTSGLAAQVGWGQNFDGAADRLGLDAGSNYTTLDALTGLTVSFWIRPTTLNWTSNQGIFCRGSSAQKVPWISGVSGASTVNFNCETNNSASDVNITTSALTSGQWNHVSFTWSGATCVGYLNGAVTGSDAVSGTTIGATNGSDFIAVFAGSVYYNGKLDELQISSVARSPDWIKLCYENQKTSSYFVDLDDYTKWSYNKTVSVNTAGMGLSGKVYDFPLLVRLTNANFNFSQAQDSGWDIRFSKTDTTHLFYEIESWDKGNQQAAVWVLVDTVFNNNATKSIMMYWGNGSAYNRSNPNKVFDTANGFVGVWHLKDASGIVTDATINTLSGTANGGPTYANAGNIGFANGFDGNGDYFNMGNNGKLDMSANDKVTISAWVNRSGPAITESVEGIAGKFAWNGSNNRQYSIQNQSTTGFQFEVSTDGSASSSTALSSGSVPTNGNWYYTTGIMDATNMYIFVDGVLKASTAKTAIFGGSGANFRVGILDDDGAYRQYWNGKIDEVRVEKTNRAADWIKLCYETQKNTQPFIDAEDYSQWPYSQKVYLNTTIGGANVRSAVTNFPTLIRIDTATFKHFSETQAGGADIRFANASGTHLPYEIEYWKDNANFNDTAVVWVKVDAVAANKRNQYITMYWGKSGVSSRSDSRGVFDTSNGFVGVWHLSQTPNTMSDASVNANTGTLQSGASSSLSAGIVGQGVLFNGINQYVSTTNTFASTAVSIFTISSWFKTSTAGGAKMVGYESAQTGASTNGDRQLWVGTDGKVRFGCNGGGLREVATTATTYADNGWHFAVGTLSSSGQFLYIDGSLAGTHSNTSGSNYTGYWRLGGYKGASWTSGSDGYFSGTIDEASVSNAARSADWIKLCYENQRSAQTFVDLENYEDWPYSQRITINTTPAGCNVSGDVYEFPLLVRLNPATFSLANFLNTQANGADIRFSKADGTHLPYEIERWQDGTGGNDTAALWVLVDTVFGNNGSQYVNMHWGRGDAASRSNPNAVFDTTNGFVGVWHMNEDPSGGVGAIKNRTAFDNDMTSSSVMLSTDVVAGNIGNGINFTPSNVLIKSPPSGLGTAAVSVSAWVKITAHRNYNDVLRHYWTGLGGWDLYANSTGVLTFGVYDGGQKKSTVSGMAAGTWYYVNGTFDGTTVLAYANGQPSLTSTTASVSLNTSDDLYIGGTSFLNGILDEAIVSKVGRSANWVKLCYETQKPTTNTNVDNDDYSQWQFSQRVYLNATSGGANLRSNQYHFPVFIRLDTATWKHFNQTSANGTDLRFAKSNGAHLTYEIERWKDVAGNIDTAAIWVKVDTVYANNKSQYINMYWGNSNAVSRSNPNAVFDTANGFSAVWHLSQTPNTMSDATLKANTGTLQSGASTSQVLGIVGQGILFNGTNQYVSTTTSFATTSSSMFTISAWFKTTVNSGRKIIGFETSQTGITASAPWDRQLFDGSDGKLRFGVNSGGINEATSTAATYSDGSWHYVVGTLGTAGQFLYVDGTLTGTNSNTSGTSYSGYWRVGGYKANGFSCGTDGYFPGTIDEAVVSTVTRSPDWIKLCYENQRANQRFVDLEDYADWPYSQDITVNTSSTGANVPGNVYDFPMLVRLNPGNFDGFASTLPNGADIRFARSDGAHLNYEIERWSDLASNLDTAEIWVRLDTVFGNNATQYFTMYWGKGGFPKRDTSVGVFDTSNGFVGVWHMAEASGTISNATFSALSGTAVGSVSYRQEGGIGYGFSSNGTDRYFFTGSNAYFNVSSTKRYTISGWANRTGGGETVQEVIAGKYNNGNNKREFALMNNAGSGFGLTSSSNGTGSITTYAQVFPVSGNWYYVTGVMDGTTTQYIYVNGMLMNSSTQSAMFSGTAPFTIGDNAGSTQGFNGKLDEIVMSNTNRSSDWIRLCYETQKRTQSSTDNDDYSTWPYSMKVQINAATGGAGIGVDQYGFPVPIRLDSTNFRRFFQTMPGGADIRFANKHGAHLPYEIERWQDGAGDKDTAVIWVRVDTVFAGKWSNYITMYWGKNGAISKSNGAAVFDTASGFRGVFHLAESGNNTAGGYRDATVMQNVMTGVSMASSSNIQGMVGMGQTFDGTSDYLMMNDASAFDFSTGAFSISMWFNKTWANRSDIFSWKNNAATDDIGLLYDVSGTSNSIDVYSTINSVGDYVCSGGAHISTSAWHNIVWTRDNSSNVIVYFDGSQYLTGTDAKDYNNVDAGTYLRFGANHTAGTPSYLLKGHLDELRLLKSGTSPDWIKLCYHTQKASCDSIVDFENYADWGASQNITVNTTATGANVLTNVYNFPMLVRLDPGTFGGFANTVAGGADVRFAKSNGLHLPYEIERWQDGGNNLDTAAIWVLLDTVFGNNSTQYFTMYYNKPGETDRSNGRTVFDTANGFRGVYHFHNSTYTNAAIVSLTGTSVATGNQAAGIAGNARLFNGSSSYLSYPTTDVASLFTLSAWIRPSGATGNIQCIMANKSVTTATGWAMYSNSSSTDNGMILGEYGNGTQSSTVSTGTGEILYTAPIPWYYLTLTTNKTTADAKIYKNGALEATTGLPLTDFSSSGVWRIGSFTNTTLFFKGDIDEPVISTTIRSPEWVKLCYETQKPSAQVITTENYADWPNSQKIYLNTTWWSGANVTSSNLYNFPVLVRLDTTNFRSFSSTQPSGVDIRFAKADGTHLPYEIERWQDVSANVDTAAIWVKMDTVYANNGLQYINMYWGNSNAASMSSPAAVFDTSNGFKAAWHFMDTTDATINSNKVTRSVEGSPNALGGLVGNSMTFGNSNYLSPGTATALGGTTNFTLACWVKTTTTGSTAFYHQRDAAGYQGALKFGLTTAGKPTFLVYNVSAQFDLTATVTVNDNNWHFLSGVRNGTAGTLYVDGVQNATAGGAVLALSNTLNCYIGRDVRDANCNYNGSIDEMTVAPVARSADWIKLCYENQRATGQSFVDMEDYATWQYNKRISINTNFTPVLSGQRFRKFPNPISLTRWCI